MAYRWVSGIKRKDPPYYDPSRGVNMYCSYSVNSPTVLKLLSHDFPDKSVTGLVNYVFFSSMPTDLEIHSIELPNGNYLVYQANAIQYTNTSISIGLKNGSTGVVEVATTVTCYYYTRTKFRDFGFGIYINDEDRTAELCGFARTEDNDDEYSNLIYFNSASSPDSVLTRAYELLVGVPTTDDDDPYEPGGNSDDDGGEGDFDGDSDPIDFPDLPTISVVDTGFVNLYNPSLAELRNLSSYMWSDLFSLASFKKIFADPMDCILGLSIVPVNVPDGGADIVTVGNISTNVIMTKAASQYVEVDCGTIHLNEYWGAYLDYAPYTKVQLYLPYIGFVQLDTDDVMTRKRKNGDIVIDKSIHVKYHIDILSGSLCAYVKCGDSVLYSYTGQCSITIPVTGNNYTQMITSIASGLVKTGVAMASGGASMASSMGRTTALINQGRKANGLTVEMAGNAEAYTRTQAVIDTGDTMASSAIGVASNKPVVERSGTLTGMAGILAIQKPYIILTRPNQCLPRNQKGYSGYPSFTTVRLSSLKGYTEIFSIHLKNVDATQSELDEIVAILNGGVII